MVGELHCGQLLWLSFTRIATATADYSTRRPLLRRLQWTRLYWAEHIDMMGFHIPASVELSVWLRVSLVMLH